MPSFDWSNMPKFLAAAARAVNAGLTATAREASRFAKIGMGRGARHTPSAPGTPPNVQRAFLRNAIGHVPSTAFRSSFGVDRSIPYARVQELGGTITAKSTKFLPIPVNNEAKRLLEKLPGGLRSATAIGQPLVLVRTPHGSFLVPAAKWATKHKGRLVYGPVFALRRSVTLPPRPFIRPVVVKNGPALKAAGVAASRRALAASGFVVGGRA